MIAHRKNLTPVAICLALLSLLFIAPVAEAEFGLSEPEITFTGPDGSAQTQAGSHPFATNISFGLNTIDEGVGKLFPDEAAKDVINILPPGFVANPTATPRCSSADFSTITRAIGLPACSDASAVGVVGVEVAISKGALPKQFNAPVFNLEPAPGSALKLGFVIYNVPITVEGRLSEFPPYNAIGAATNISQTVSFYGTTLTLWGNPADPAHDSIRGSCADAVKTGPLQSKGECPVSIPQKPLFTMPTSCTGPLPSVFEAGSWQHPGPPYPYREQITTAFGNSGCGKLGFSPQIALQPTSQAAEAPTGLDVNLDVADEGLTNPTGIARSAIQAAEVTLPPGVTINPSQAEGLGVCSEAELERERSFSQAGQGCPNSSKIGTVEVETPLLEGQILKGALFVAKPYENRFGSLIALYMVFRERELGIAVKLAGKVTPDPRTGQLVTSFKDLPELPFSHFRLHFREGGRSPLVNPPTCGAYTAQAKFTPASNPAKTFETTSSFQVTSGVGGGACPAGVPPFKPQFEAGSLNNAAGAFSPFYMRLRRADGEQDMTKFSSILPPGELGSLARVGKCPEAAIAAAKARTGISELVSPSCPASSQIGRTKAGAGVGDELTYVGGKLYLAGPYNGDPLSVVSITPAVAGPFDVGNVVVRLALTLNPKTAEVEVDGASSDPIPHILAGIPLKVRDLRVYADRPNFTLNPTGCEESSTKATLFGGFLDVFSAADDVPVELSSRYQAAGCAGLGFKPALQLTLKGGTKRGDFPALTGVFRPRPGDANLAGLVLRLPHSAFLEQSHIRTICTRVQFAAKACPAGAIYGSVKAWTPLLDEPLEGPVYLRSSSNPLPDFVAALHGIVDVEAVAKIDSKNGGIRATFIDVPDAPLSKVVVSMQGGKKGLIVNSTNLCAKAQRANASFTAHNGKQVAGRPEVKAKCKRRG